MRPWSCGSTQPITEKPVPIERERRPLVSWIRAELQKRELLLASTFRGDPEIVALTWSVVVVDPPIKPKYQ